MLLGLLELGFKPFQDTADFVILSPRCSNTVADHAVNATMDHGESWWRMDEQVLRRGVGELKHPIGKCALTEAFGAAH